MTAQEIRLNRDREHDILYVLKHSADPSTTTNVPVNADVVLRISKDREIVGFIIDDFSIVCPEWKDSDDYHLMEEFEDILKVLNDKCARNLTQAASQAASEA